MDIQSLDKEEPVPYIMSGEGAAPEQVPGVAAEMSIQSLPELGAESTVISELTAETPKASKDAAGLVVLGVAGDYSHDTVTAAVVTGDGPAADALPAEVIGVSSGAVPQPAMTAAAPPAVTQAALEPVARISTEQVSVAMSEPVPIVTIELASGLAPGSEPGVPSTAAAATAVPVNVVPVAISSAVSMPPPSAEAVPIATTIPSTSHTKAVGACPPPAGAGSVLPIEGEREQELIVPDLVTVSKPHAEPLLELAEKQVESKPIPGQPESEPMEIHPEPEPMQSQPEPEPEPESMNSQPEPEPEPRSSRRRAQQERVGQESVESLPALAAPEPEPEPGDLHCLVCNDPVESVGGSGGAGDNGGLHLADYLENAHIRIEDKLSGIINNDYRLYLHSEVVCDRCHTTLCQIHDLEMQTKHLKDQVVGFFWDTVEVRRVRPQRKGRRKSRPSKLLLESQESALFMPEVDIKEDPSDVIYKAPQKKIGRYSKPKVYEKLSSNEYQCIRCHKVLPRMRAVVKHFDLVHGRKEEQCDICEKYFRDRPHLLRHKQKMHPDAADAAEAPAATATSTEPSTSPAGDAPTGSADPVPAAVEPAAPAAAGEPPAVPSGTESRAAAAAAVKHESVDISADLPASLDDGASPPLGDDDDYEEEEDVDDVDDEDYIADRLPVIDDDDEDGEVDMDVVMNVEVERPRRAQKRRSSSQSYPLGPEVGVMYTESADGTSPRFRCMLCTNTYSRAAKARDHFIAKHAQIKRFKCTLCSEMFLTYKQKRHHELSHTAEMCTKCGKKYPGNKRGMLERHVAQCGELKRCRVCGAEFQNMSDFIKHRRDAHEKSATCDVCGKVVSARNLASHRAIHSDERNYTCHLCGSSFKAKGSLDTHLRTHSEDRPFSCATCGRSFKHRNNWKDHERGHLNIRDFVCHFCSKSFKQAKNLKQHLRQHDANPEIFTCPHCPSTFRYKYNMLAHVKTLHTGETSRRVRRRMRAPSELSASGSAASGGPAGGTHAVLVGLDPLQLSPGSVTSDSNSGVHVVAAAPAGTAVAAGSRSLPQLNPLNPSVVFMQTLQHHSIFSS
ncbi:uncharacterized protein LOC122383428 isoform X2 [Amphibalanus amphitrite]|uniref:uncharacterized protein LOC122383428 isoform X2 n=1 Tax=Amphibalanus amphitrite TaxID=1232801 RepID=UPI001C90EC83|nr:uncharacterized protein LOC122383428 isoform X2 [Amphibalanus amphitrite]XP_043225754.1 uncharacterized protein LOC122383428 isoform X2 [Amphibalanus amphitrite]XP_043225755.1 uncharacterized protein LOC122383428 isoform X2 [Amphibalanus amphitrite]XP_043225756.1 uncharacterized protein LOC122383428 isoform X2 [Amphibalanus amphitrite]